MRYNSNYITDTPDGINKLRKALADAEAVVIGAGAGLSTSAGFTYAGERLQKYFGDFVSKYNIPDMYSGGFMVMQLSPEIMWAYWARYIYINRYMSPPRPVYENLYHLVDDREAIRGSDSPRKDYFVITTNVDHCFQKAGFDKHRLFYTQGDYGLWQCSKPCHNQTYDNEETVRKMVMAQGFTIDEDGNLCVPQIGPNMPALGNEFESESETNSWDYDKIKMEIPTDLIPRCPVCGEPMTMNLRADDTFVQDEGWDRAAERYSEFLRRHRNMKTLFIDIASGMNTPTIVKFSFWRLVNQWPDATYACLNLGEAFAPKELGNKAICIDGDIGDIVEQLQAVELK